MSKVIDLQAESWNEEVVKYQGPVVIDFWHHMCGWCLKLNPIFERLPQAFENVKFMKLNILESNENRKIAMENGVMGTPTIKVYCLGRSIGEVVGFKQYEGLVKDIEQILSSMDDCLEMSTPLE